MRIQIINKKHNDIDRNQEAELKLLQKNHFYKKKSAKFKFTIKKVPDSSNELLETTMKWS
jgi:hypothetical protein